MSTTTLLRRRWSFWFSGALIGFFGAVVISAQQPGVAADASVLDVMMVVVVPHSTAIFDVADPPTKADEWASIASHATALRQAGDMMLTPARARDQKEWLVEVEAYNVAAGQVGKAATAKNFDALLEASDGLAATCTHCHTRYLGR